MVNIPTENGKEMSKLFHQKQQNKTKQKANNYLKRWPTLLVNIKMSSI